jgi:hypothetical protein
MQKEHYVYKTETSSKIELSPTELMPKSKNLTVSKQDEWAMT